MRALGCSAKLVKEGNLVLFMGSGICNGYGGQPTWTELLRELAKEANLSPKEIEVIETMDYIDAARVIELRMGGTSNLNKAVAKKVQIHSYSLACGLLASLPLREVITTNFNEMYELCCRSLGINVALLPYSPAFQCDRWLLKLYGCVTHPEDIVFSREHYMRYSTRRSALSGIVQSLLITKHMLFVGFSLKDDNFHRIIDEVRRSVRTGLPDDTNSPRKESNEETYTMSFKERKFGTQLVLNENLVSSLLWDEDVNVVPMLKQQEKNLRGIAARKFDIFLDYMNSLATSTTSFLLNPKYDALLEDGQRALRDSLNQFISEISPIAKNAPEYDILKKLFMELGWTDGALPKPKEREQDKEEE
eukprot:TRINITY_DN20757_c0_g1_i1.p1 TRINITY_DN20757_c0_g1~~TRINITY_DN20757_c0_g1_i1.p1  ORF type:complete len:362 (-),score=87.38 TRINITY_DN20757_c0_g1_i1:59-1144(-)